MSQTRASTSATAESPAAGGHGLRHIRELDGIRGLAALVVFGHHAMTTTVRETLQGGWPSSIQTLSRTFEFGNTGVDLFFVLSGFLITSILLGEQRSTRYYQDFYWKRALRILPVYLLLLPVVWVFFRQTEQSLMALFFVVNFAGFFRMRVIERGPFWSLAIEEQFYLIWPTIVRRLSLRQILRCSILIGMASVLLRFLIALRWHGDYEMTPFRCDGLAFGAALACHFFVAGNNVRLRRRITSLMIGLGICGCLLVAAALQVELLGRMHNATFQTGVVLVSGSAIGLVIAYTGSPWLAVFRTRLLTFFGLISYAFYMVHIYVIYIYKHFAGQRLAPGDVHGYWMQVIVSLAGSTALALLLRYTVELPFMRLRKYVLRHPNRGAEHADPPLPLAQM